MEPTTGRELAGTTVPQPHGTGATRDSVVEQADRMVRDLIRDLADGNHAAAEVCEIGARHATAPSLQVQLARRAAEQTERARQLERYGAERGVEPPDGGRHLVSRARAHLGRLRGDRGLERATRGQLERLRGDYRQALERRGLPTELRDLLRSHLD
jgi:hypothetical protein